MCKLKIGNLHSLTCVVKVKRSEISFWKIADLAISVTIWIVNGDARVPLVSQDEMGLSNEQALWKYLNYCMHHQSAVWLVY